MLININPKILFIQDSYDKSFTKDLNFIIVYSKPIISSPLIVIPSGELVINIAGSYTSNQDRQKASKEARHSMEVVDATGVMDLELVQEKRLPVIIVRLTLKYSGSKCSFLTKIKLSRKWLKFCRWLDICPMSLYSKFQPPG